MQFCRQPLTQSIVSVSQPKSKGVSRRQGNFDNFAGHSIPGAHFKSKAALEYDLAGGIRVFRSRKTSLH